MRIVRLLDFPIDDGEIRPTSAPAYNALADLTRETRFGQRRWRAEKVRRSRLLSANMRRPGNGGWPVMLDLQREQFEHDERFHREILRLSIHARLNHMALHYCKYTGQFAIVCAAADNALRSRTITDSFIISLCAANALNLSLSETIADPSESVLLCDLGQSLSRRLYPKTTLNDHWLLIEHAVYSGKMARACEKIDHLEAFPFREEARAAVIRLCQIALIAANVNSIDLLYEARERRSGIRRGNPFLTALSRRED